MEKNELHIAPDEWIVAYLNHELDADRQAALEEWVEADPAHKRYLYEMTEAWLASTAILGNTAGSEQAYLRFRTRLENKGRITNRLFRFYWAAAAVLAALLLTGGGFYWGTRRTLLQPLQAMQTIEVPLGSKSRLLLPDGSVVWLNAGSKLSYNTTFSQQEREVKLEGQGYFEVARNEKLPFVVHTELIDVRVLGTKFDVKAYGDEEQVEVTLAEGAVHFRNKKEPASSLTLVPQQQVIYNKKDGKTDVKKVSAEQTVSWISGSHFFNELTLEQIAARLEKAFDVTFIFREEGKKKLTFYGDFREEDTLEDILTILSSSHKFKYRKTHAIIEIY